MTEYVLPIILLGALLAGALGMMIFGLRSAKGMRSAQVFMLAACGIVGAWLLRSPEEAKRAMEGAARGVLEFATRFF